MKNVNWLWAAIIVTLAYTVVLTVIMGPQKALTFLHTDQLNEVGDFLAGVFAPLAFIWLVAAVLTQRQELNETRDQFLKNQKIVDGQLKTINTQNDLLKQQHTLAEESARKSYKLSLFDTRIQIYHDLLDLHDYLELNAFGAAEWRRLIRLTQKSSFAFGRHVYEHLEQQTCEGVDLFAFETLNRAVLTQGKQGEPEFEKVRREITARQNAIRNSISMSKLDELMWKSLYINED